MNPFDRKSRGAPNGFFLLLLLVYCHQWNSIYGPSTVHGLDRYLLQQKKNGYKYASECVYEWRVVHSQKHLKRFDASACYNVSHFSIFPAFSACLYINSMTLFFPHILIRFYYIISIWSILLCNFVRLSFFALANWPMTSVCLSWAWKVVDVIRLVVFFLCVHFPIRWVFWSVILIWTCATVQNSDCWPHDGWAIAYCYWSLSTFKGVHKHSHTLARIVKMQLSSLLGEYCQCLVATTAAASVTDALRLSFSTFHSWRW